MAALAAGRTTKRRGEIHHRYSRGLNASATVYEGGLVAFDVATGYLVAGRVSTTDIVKGVARDTYVNDATAGAKIAHLDAGVFCFASGTAADAIAADDIGKLCYVIDDQTVGVTDGTATRVIAGRIFDVDSHGVWVAVGLPESN